MNVKYPTRHVEIVGTHKCGDGFSGNVVKVSRKVNGNEEIIAIFCQLCGKEFNRKVFKPKFS